MRFTVVVMSDPESDAYIASVPALPGCHTWGRTPKEAVKMAREAALGMLEDMIEAGDPIPEEVRTATMRLG